MRPLDRKTLLKIVHLVGDRLHGDWIVIGGTVLPLLGSDYRSTVDIDIVGPASATQKDMLELMEIASELHLPVETINQAGAFFLFKIKTWEKKLVLLHQGKTARVYRPNVNLFLELKVARLNETDLSDCLEFMLFAKKNNEAIDRKHLDSVIQRKLTNTANPAQKDRLQKLLAALSEADRK